MVYLERFYFCGESKRVYPYNVMAPKDLGFCHFGPITLFYGSNGSGKSTVLNIMARAINVPNMSPGNTDEYLNGYVRKCGFKISEQGIPFTSRFIRSEDIMDGINRVRQEHDRINRMASRTRTQHDEGESKWMSKWFDPDSMTDQDRFFLSSMQSAGYTFAKLNLRQDQYSNGESSLDYFNNELLPDSLYFLDEPENSLAPQFQLLLAEKIQLLAYYLNCQIIIATHSPFLLSMRGTTIIDLDSIPSKVRKWYELPNMRVYYEFFNNNRDVFEK